MPGRNAPSPCGGPGRSAGLRWTFASETLDRSLPPGAVRLVELDDVARRVLQERLTSCALDPLQPLGAHAGGLELGEARLEVVDDDREVRAGIRDRATVADHDVDLFAGALHPRALDAEIRSILYAGHAEQLVEADRHIEVFRGDGDVLDADRLHVADPIGDQRAVRKTHLRSSVNRARVAMAQLASRAITCGMLDVISATATLDNARPATATVMPPT